MQMARGGVPTAIIGIPLKYMHTSIELISTIDIERAARLIAGFAQALTDDTVQSLVPEI
jgi:endoglucanase